MSRTIRIIFKAASVVALVAKALIIARRKP